MKSEQAAFAERLRAALAAAKITDKPVELVKLVARHGGGPVSQQAVSNWLNGKNMPRHQNLRALAKLLRMDPTRLQYGEEDGRKVRDKQGEWRVGALDQHAIDAFIALPEPQRKLVRALIDELGHDDRKKKRST